MARIVGLARRILFTLKLPAHSVPGVQPISEMVPVVTVAAARLALWLRSKLGLLHEFSQHHGLSPVLFSTPVCQLSIVVSSPPRRTSGMRINFISPFSPHSVMP